MPDLTKPVLDHILVEESHVGNHYVYVCSLHDACLRVEFDQGDLSTADGLAIAWGAR